MTNVFNIVRNIVLYKHKEIMKLQNYLIGDLVISNNTKAFFITDAIEENGTWFYTDGNRWFAESILKSI